MDVLYFSYGNNIIIDDIVFPNGRTQMGQLGGGSLYAVLGMRIWSQQVGIVSGIGSDFSKECRDYLKSSTIDLEGLLTRNMPTPRAWQILEWDERRIEIFRTDLEQFNLMLPTSSEVPASYQSAIGIHTFDFGNIELVKELRIHFPQATLIWEPYLPPNSNTIDREGIFNMLPSIDAFLPSYSEMTRLYNTTDIDRILSNLLDTGVKTVAIRMGSTGSVVSNKEGHFQRIPAYQTQVIDVLGAGNAYSGGFLVEYARSGDAVNAGLYGAIAASFTIEQFGPLIITSEIEQEAKNRYQWLRDQISY